MDGEALASSQGVVYRTHMPFQPGVKHDFTNRAPNGEADKEHLRRISPGPRYKLAAKLYVSGNAKSKKQAAELADVDYGYFLALTNYNDEIREIMGTMEEAVDEKLLETPHLLTRFGREAVTKIAQIMRTTDDEEVALKAAKDLADRSEETSTIKKSKVSTSNELSVESARALASALVEAAKQRALHAGSAASGSHVSNAVHALPSAEILDAP